MNRRVALVTGASRGIGRAIAAALIDRGYCVAVGYRFNKTLADELITDPYTAQSVEIDVASTASVDRAISAVEARLGPIEILVNNAGISQVKSFPELTDKDWERILSVNLLGAVRCCRRVVPGMAERGYGRIVNIASVGGQWGGTHQVHYAAAKAGLINFTKSMAKLYSGFGICCNALAPGLIATDMIAEEMSDTESRVKVQGIPAMRLGTPEEVASLALYLCSDQASYITGQTFNVNGGMYLLG